MFDCLVTECDVRYFEWIFASLKSFQLIRFLCPQVLSSSPHLFTFMAKVPTARPKKLTREDTAQVLKDDLVKDLVSAFSLFKGNSRDRLGREELRPILKQFNITGANVEEMIKSVNQNLSLLVCFSVSYVLFCLRIFHIDFFLSAEIFYTLFSWDCSLNFGSNSGNGQNIFV